MSEQTFIPGKAKSLEESIANLQQIAQEVGFQIEEGLKLNPVSGIHSLHIFEKTCPGVFTNGKGASEKATLASALGEFLERLSTNYFFSDYWLERTPGDSADNWLYYPDEKSFTKADFRQMLSPQLWRFYADLSTSPGYERFKAENYEFAHFLSFNDHLDQVRALPLRCVQTDEVHYFPVNLLSNLYASNGLSAGNSALEAQIQSLSEVFERWVKNRILRENLCLPLVPDEVIARFPQVQKAIDALAEEGIYTEVRDASLGGKYPVMNVTLFDQKQGRCFASFGAHPIFEVALERTLTESLQGRHLRDLDGFQMPSFDDFAVAADENLENHFIDSSGLIHGRFISHQYDFSFKDWGFNGDFAAQWDYLCDLVTQEGAQVYVANYRQFGFESCRILVPGMSEVYPRHELIEANQNLGRELRDALLAYPQEQDPLKIVELIEDLGFSDHQGVASLIGLMADKGSFWGNLNCLQLKFWCQLKAQVFEEAIESLLDIRYFIQTDSPWYPVYRAFEYALEMQLHTPEEGFSIEMSGMPSLFGKAISEQVFEHLEGHSEFWQAPLGIEIFTQSKQHQRLLDIYQNCRKFKSSHASVEH
ncbi:MAG: YcaO-like family protein [Thiotrichales bacterium]|nr:YcaO-like family protein [Thiotrichales bacterium]